MSNDYTLPCLPGPVIAKKYGQQVEYYGQACADAARAPLLARIAELEAQAERERLAQLACDAESSCFEAEFSCLEDENGMLSAERDRLRAEVVALRCERDALLNPCARLVAMDFGAEGWGPLCEAQGKAIRDALGAIAARAAQQPGNRTTEDCSVVDSATRAGEAAQRGEGDSNV
jgi:hypothetical protein